MMNRRPQFSGRSEGRIKSPRAQKDGGANGEQRKHLVERVSSHANCLKSILWKQSPSEPPEVEAARKLVEEWDQAIDRQKAAKVDDLREMVGFLREAILFRSREEALALVRSFEELDIEGLGEGLPLIANGLPGEAEDARW